jgi:hypothetical protein
VGVFFSTNIYIYIYIHIYIYKKENTEDWKKERKKYEEISYGTPFLLIRSWPQTHTYTYTYIIYDSHAERERERETERERVGKGARENNVDIYHLCPAAAGWMAG